MENENRHFRIVFETESGLSEMVRVRTEGELSKALITMLKKDWNKLLAGDTIRIIEEE